IKYPEIKNIQPIIHESIKLKVRRHLLILKLAALLIFIVALARPQSGQRSEDVETKGIDIMLALDSSYSMKTEDFKTCQVPATTFCTFNVDVFPFNNVHIRKAFNYAINRAQIVRNITQLNEEPALGIIPPVLKKNRGKAQFFQDADIETARFHFKKGLEELNLTEAEFPRIKYLYATSEAHHKIAQALQQQWFATLGITIELENVDKKILLHLLKTRNYQAAQSFWMAQYNDTMNILERFKYKENVKNYPNWENEEYVKLLNLSCEARTDEERFALLDQAEEIFLDEMAIAPIFHWNSAYIAKPYVKSFGIAPIGNGFFDRVYIDSETKTQLR
ncbi:MAG: hypothetical protein K1000chlam2_00821, partial [Chlamydiae bacterium]|nr:hypothetical protein [Chlamydiota bacterium]